MSISNLFPFAGNHDDPHVADIGVRGAGLDEAAAGLKVMVGVVAAEMRGGVEA
jgi:hypothetical protein